MKSKCHSAKHDVVCFCWSRKLCCVSDVFCDAGLKGEFACKLEASPVARHIANASDHLWRLQVRLLPDDPRSSALLQRRRLHVLCRQPHSVEGHVLQGAQLLSEINSG